QRRATNTSPRRGERYLKCGAPNGIHRRGRKHRHNKIGSVRSADRDAWRTVEIERSGTEILNGKCSGGRCSYVRIAKIGTVSRRRRRIAIRDGKTVPGNVYLGNR